MKPIVKGGCTLLALALCANLAISQVVTEIPAMTVSNSAIDMDNVGPAGPTTLAAIKAAGLPAPAANITGLVLTPSTAAVGVYNTNAGYGRALGYDLATNGMILVDPPSGVFDAFDAQITLGTASTEFGLLVGDWVSTMTLDFYLGPTLQTSFLTSSYTTGGPTKFFQMTGGTFDRIDIRASSTVGNWVINEIHVEAGCTASWGNYGAGYPGTLGVPALIIGGNPVFGGNPGIKLTSSSPVPETSILFLGTSKATIPGFWGGDLLVTPLTFAVIPAAPPGWKLPLPIPNNPALCGFAAYLQVVQSDQGALNGASSTPGLEMVLGL